MYAWVPPRAIQSSKSEYWSCMNVIYLLNQRIYYYGYCSVCECSAIATWTWENNQLVWSSSRQVFPLPLHQTYYSTFTTIKHNSFNHLFLHLAYWAHLIVCPVYTGARNRMNKEKNLVRKKGDCDKEEKSLRRKEQHEWLV